MEENNLEPLIYNGASIDTYFENRLK